MGGLLARLPRGDRDEDLPWGRRHDALILVLAGCGPLLLLAGLLAGASAGALVAAAAVPLLAAAAARVLSGRRVGAAVVTVGLTGTCLALVALTGGAPEASLSFVVVVVLLAAYGDWAPPACAGAVAVLVDVAAVAWGVPAATALVPRFALLHGAAVLLTCVAVVGLLALTERERLRHEHAEATSRLLLDLARRPAALPAHQGDLLWLLEESERDPYVREELRRAGLLAARMRRDAENLLVLSGRRPDRADPEPATLSEVIRVAVAATEGGDRVAVSGDGGASVVARTVADLTHVLAELVDNAVRHSGPGASVQVVVRAHGWGVGSQQVVVTDAGPGMDGPDREAANRLLGGRDARRPGGGVGLAVAARLAARHRIEVSLRDGGDHGLAAVLVLPESVLVAAGEEPGTAAERREATRSRQPAPTPGPDRSSSARSWPPVAPSRSTDAAPAAPAAPAVPAAPAPPVPVSIPVAPVVRVVPTVHATHHATPHASGHATHTPAHAPHAAHRRVPPTDPATLPATAPPTVPSPVGRGRHARRAAGADELPATAPIVIPEVAPVYAQPVPDLSAGWFDAAEPVEELVGEEPAIDEAGAEDAVEEAGAEEAVEEPAAVEEPEVVASVEPEPAEVALPTPRAADPAAAPPPTPPRPLPPSPRGRSPRSRRRCDGRRASSVPTPCRPRPPPTAALTGPDAARPHRHRSAAAGRTSQSVHSGR